MVSGSFGSAETCWILEDTEWLLHLLFAGGCTEPSSFYRGRSSHHLHFWNIFIAGSLTSAALSPPGCPCTGGLGDQLQAEPAELMAGGEKHVSGWVNTWKQLLLYCTSDSNTAFRHLVIPSASVDFFPTQVKAVSLMLTLGVVVDL